MDKLPSHQPSLFDYTSSSCHKNPARRCLTIFITIIIMLWVVGGILVSWLPDMVLSVCLLRHHSLLKSYLFPANHYLMEEPPDLWEGLKGGEHCLRYATREYTARLRSAELPSGEDAMKACRESPVEIHGKTLYSDFCQNLGFGRGVWGFWIVSFDEPDCETKWVEFEDLGCTENLSYIELPIRRVEGHLENLQPGSDWQFMCVTTPADIYGRHFPTPSDCFNMGHLDILGVWDITDKSCAVGADSKSDRKNGNAEQA